MKSEEILSIIISVVFGIFLLFFNNLILSKILNVLIINVFLNALAIFVPLIIIFLILNQKEKTRKEMEVYFSSFLRDLSEGIKSGKNIVLIFEDIANNDYKSLTPLVKKMASEIKLGIPFDKALYNLAKRSESKLIKKLSLTVGEAVKAGGDMSSVIEATISSLIESEKIKKEREMIAAPTKVNGFLIYFMFLAIIIILLKFLIPTIGEYQSGAIFQKKVNINILEIKNIILHLILIQSFFNGLLIGKMSEGSVIVGLRYSIILMIIGYLTFSLSA
ncbi:MAG: type II secretion system F family protein [Candidatus Aenigmatarchaeota archaeon]